METRILNGKTIAEQIRLEVAAEIEILKRRGVVPGLAVVLVGDNPASQVYVRNKTRTCEELGMHSRRLLLEKDLSTEMLLGEIGRLNADEEIDGILVQLPLPEGIRESLIVDAVDPAKDVDGFHPVNVGRLCSGRPALAPCTPVGILEMLRREKIPLMGAEAVVLGRSNIVGKPMALLLLQEHATVTICHSRTRNLEQVCRRADILVAAVGRAGLVTARHIKPGAVVVDVGINRIETREELLHLYGEDERRLEDFERRGYVLVGDVHPTEALGVAGALTPVPGGVGPLTIAQLMRNTLEACKKRRGLTDV